MLEMHAAHADAAWAEVQASAASASTPAGRAVREAIEAARATGRRVALDLGVGAGGMARSLLAAGFEVVGMDLHDDPRRPEAVRFVQVSWHDLRARDVARAHVGFGSGVCTGFSTARPDKVNRPNQEDYENSFQVWTLLQHLPAFVFENVAGSVNHLSPRFGPPFLKTRGHYFWGVCPPFLLDQSNLPGKGYRKRPGGGTLRPQNDARARAMIPEAIGGPIARALATVDECPGCGESECPGGLGCPRPDVDGGGPSG